MSNFKRRLLRRYRGLFEEMYWEQRIKEQRRNKIAQLSAVKTGFVAGFLSGAFIAVYVYTLR